MLNGWKINFVYKLHYCITVNCLCLKKKERDVLIISMISITMLFSDFVCNKRPMDHITHLRNCFKQYPNMSKSIIIPASTLAQKLISKEAIQYFNVMIISTSYREEYPLESPCDVLMMLCTKFSFGIGPLGLEKNIKM